MNDSVKQLVEKQHTSSGLTEEPAEKEVRVVEQTVMLVADQIVLLMNVEEELQFQFLRYRAERDQLVENATMGFKLQTNS